MNARNATLELHGQELLIIRLIDGVHIDNEAIAEVMHGMTLAHECGPLSVVIVIPEDIRIDPKAVCTDHRPRLLPRMRVNALAVVTTSLTAATMTELYFAFFPSMAPVRLFRELNEACAWACQTTYQRSVA